MWRVLCSVVAVAAVTASCGGASAAPPVIGNLRAFRQPPGFDQPRIVWFVRDGHMWPVERRRGQLMDELLAGPNAAERAAGVRTMIPPSTRLLGVHVPDFADQFTGGVTVNLSSSFADPGSTRDLELRVAQVVLTAQSNGLLFGSAGQDLSIQVDGRDELFPTPPGPTVAELDGQQFTSLLGYGAMPFSPAIGERIDGKVVANFEMGKGPLRNGSASVVGRVVLLNAGGRPVARAAVWAENSPALLVAAQGVLDPHVTHVQRGTLELFLSPSWWPAHSSLVLTYPVVLAPPPEPVRK